MPSRICMRKCCCSLIHSYLHHWHGKCCYQTWILTIDTWRFLDVSSQIQTFTIALFETNRDPNKFKLHLRDFLIQLTEFGASDELFLDEREAESEAKRKMEREAALRIPGLVKPSDLPTMDE